MIDIVDANSGNIDSWTKLLDDLLINYKVVSKTSEMSAKTILLPGVGSAGFLMENLRIKGFDKKIKNFYRSGGRVIGVCLGYQVFTGFSVEDGGIKCLGLIKGKTKKLKILNSPVSNNGWSNFSIKKDKLREVGCFSDFHLSKKTTIDGRVYFNHEYGVEVASKLGFSCKIQKKGLENYSAAYFYKNLYGIQFHPEKSQFTGLEFIKCIL